METIKLDTARPPGPTALEWEPLGPRTFQSWKIDIPGGHELSHNPQALFNELCPSIKEKICMEFRKNEIPPDFSLTLSVARSTNHQPGYVVKQFKAGYKRECYSDIHKEGGMDLMLIMTIDAIYYQIGKYITEGGVVDMILRLIVKVETLPTRKDI